MCLTKVDKEMGKNDKICNAYKIMCQKVVGDVISFQFPYYPINKRMHLGDIKSDTSKRTLISANHEWYDCGFHCYTNKKTAIKEVTFKKNHGHNHYCVVRVRAWDIRAKGRQSNGNTIVAKNIQLIEKIL
jgi:hypothetical protein